MDAIRNLNASASLRSGLITSEEVDRRAQRAPYSFCEFPVDPADLDAVVVLGREVAAESSDGHEQEDRQADEDVRAVQARQAVEDRPERAVVRREADAGVLARLRQ